MNWYRLGVLLWVLMAASCGLFGGGEAEEEEATDPKATLVGRIASINEKQGFVLVEGYGDWSLGEDLLLSSYGGQNERSATLVVSGERMGRYTAADVKSGDLQVGDQVYARQVQEEKEPVDQNFVADPAAVAE